MNNAYVEKAREKIRDPKLLSIVASKRATQLARGARATVRSMNENFLDISLREIAAGNVILDKLTVLPEEEEVKEQDEE
jgi:DNA-directed RNA polymerase subunit K/omega